MEPCGRSDRGSPSMDRRPHRRPRCMLAAFFAVSLLCSLRPSHAFHTGDYVPMARRAQFHGSRTQWHDLLGRHCPRFATNRQVVIQLPKPFELQPGDDYKVSFAVDGMRHHTPWLTVLRHGPMAATALPPVISFELTHSGSEVTSVHATAAPLPPHFAALHADVVAEYRNASHWPKPVLVRYYWREEVEVDANRGMLVLLGMCLLLSAAGLLEVFRAAVIQSHGLNRVVGELRVPAGDGDEAASRGGRAPTGKFE